MKKTKMRVISFIVALAMLVAALPLTVIASELSSEADAPDSSFETAVVINDGETLALTVPKNDDVTYTYVKFTPETAGTYWLYSESDTDPRVVLYSSEFERIDEADDENGWNFSLLYDYEAGKTYYFAICDWEGEKECKITLNAHEHTPSEQRDCRGTLCDTCYEYYGEPAFAHKDENGDYWCEVCDLLTTDLTVTVGKNTVSLICEEYVYYKFIPTESGKYYFRSASQFDPKLYVCDENDRVIDENDEFDNDHNFYLELELEAGKAYYLKFYEYEQDNDCSVYIYNEPCDEHTPSEQRDCRGTACDRCGEYYGEPLHKNEEGDSWCDVCGSIITDLTVTVGKNTVPLIAEKSVWSKFIPAESGKYYFKSLSPFDPALTVYDENGDYIDYNDGFGNSANFYLELELEAGKVYYLEFYEYDYDNDCAVYIYNEPCDEHTQGERYCIGYECSVCGTLYGEGNGIHTPSVYANCRGIQCGICWEYYGKPAYDHKSEDGDSWCDECGSIFTDLTVTVGKNTVPLIRGEWVCYKLIPAESGKYYFRSASPFDPALSVCNENGNVIGYNDSFGNSYNFYLELELEAGKAYYLEFYEYDQDNDCTVYIYNKPCDEHTPSEQRDCRGTLCDRCGEYYGDPVHKDEEGDSWCDECYSIITDLTVTVGKNTVSLIRDEDVYYKFIPTESGTYYFKSASQFDPKLYVYDEDGILIGNNDDFDGDRDRNFYLELELEAGKVYYLELYEYNYDNDCTVTINKPCEEHVFTDYGYDNFYHWKVCSVCEIPDATGEVMHEYDADDVCECGRERLVDAIYLGTVLLLDGQYMDNDGNVSATAPAGGYAYYKDGVLTLNNFELLSYDLNSIDNSSVIYSETDLEIMLIGFNLLSAFGDYALLVSGADLAIGGNGSLLIAGDNAICVRDGNLTVNGGTISVTASTYGFAIDGDAEINGGSIYVESYGIGFMVYNDFTINGGFFEISAEVGGILTGGVITINGGFFNFLCDQIAISSYTEIKIGDDMSEVKIEGETGGFYWVDSDGNAVSCGQIMPKDEEKTILSYNWVNEALVPLVYNGEVQNPFGTIYNADGTPLVLGVDYTVEFSSEVKNAGMYFARVTGIGDYVGSYVIPFVLNAKLDLKPGSALDFDAETPSDAVSTFVEFTAPTTAEYTFTIILPDGFTQWYNVNLEYQEEYRTEDGVIIITLKLNAGETVYLRVTSLQSEPALATMSVEFVCDEHDMEATVSKKPTCTEGGEMTYTCKYGCGHTYTEALDPLEHDMGATVSKEPTCTEGGEMTYTCQHGCGHTYTEDLAPNGHNFVEITDNYVECNVCGEGICDHICHAEKGIDALVWKIFDFLYDILDIESECDCGEMH